MENSVKLKTTNTSLLIKAIREKCKLSHKEMSNALNLSHSATYQWEKGHCVPSKKSVERIVMIFGDFAPEECVQLQLLASGFASNAARWGRGKNERAERSYAKKYAETEPLCKIRVGIHTMQVHDWGKTYRGKQFVLNCFEETAMNAEIRTGFRYSMLHKDENGLYFRRKGLRFYLVDATEILEDWNSVFG